MATTILDFLREAQEVQIKVATLNDCHSIHIDQSSTPNRLSDNGEHYLSFEVTLFDEIHIIQSWEFYDRDDQEELQHKLEDLQFRINHL